MTSCTTFAMACSAFALSTGIAAAAEPLKATVGGYMHIGVGYLDAAGSTGGDVDVIRDGEIHFGFKGSSDNGLTFDGRVELEAFGATDQIDENWARVSGSFGAIMIGANDTAKTEMAVGVLYAPGDKVGYYDDDAMQGLTGAVDGAGDQMGLHYYSPEVYGFSFGASYISDTNSDGAKDGAFKVAADQAYSLALRYDGGFGDVTYAVATGWEQIDVPGGLTQDSYSLGGEMATLGFTVALYWERNFDDTNDYTGGLAYATGPWTVAAGYARTETAGAADVDTYAGWVSYALAPGVSMSAGAAHADGGGVSGTSAQTWLSLRF